MDAKVKQTVRRKPANAVSLLVSARCTYNRWKNFDCLETVNGSGVGGIKNQRTH